MKRYLEPLRTASRETLRHRRTLLLHCLQCLLQDGPLFNCQQSGVNQCHVGLNLNCATIRPRQFHLGMGVIPARCGSRPIPQCPLDRLCVACGFLRCRPGIPI